MSKFSKAFSEALAHAMFDTPAPRSIESDIARILREPPHNIRVKVEPLPKTEEETGWHVEAEHMPSGDHQQGWIWYRAVPKEEL